MMNIRFVDSDLMFSSNIYNIQAGLDRYLIYFFILLSLSSSKSSPSLNRGYMWNKVILIWFQKYFAVLFDM